MSPYRMKVMVPNRDTSNLEVRNMGHPRGIVTLCALLTQKKSLTAKTAVC
jgi:hypothetical protein